MGGKKVSLVLSSGGARGIAHIAIIDELIAREYEIVSVAGTSMGAFVGGVYASGNLELLKEWMYTLKPVDIVKLFDFSFSSNGLVKGERIFQELGKIFSDVNIEEMPIPYVAISTDIAHNKEIIHDHGSLFNAIRASISIPTFFKPFKKDEHLLVDGGLLNPAPVNRVKRFEGDSLFVVNVETIQSTEPLPIISTELKKMKITETASPLKYHGMPGYIQIINKTIGIMLGQLAELTIEKYDTDLVINIDRELFGTYDFHKYKEIMEVGRLHARAYLDEFEKKTAKK